MYIPEYIMYSKFVCINNTVECIIKSLEVCRAGCQGVTCDRPPGSPGRAHSSDGQVHTHLNFESGRGGE